MKITVLHSVLLSGFIFLQIPIFSQTIYFNKALDLGGIFGSGHSIIANDTDYSLSGVVGGGRINIGLISLDLQGDIYWFKKYGESGIAYFDGRSGSLKKVNNYMILGGSVDYDSIQVGYFLKLNHQGDTLISKEFSSQISDYMIFNNCCTTIEGGYAFTGECYVTGYNADVIVLNTDSMGDETWRQLSGWNTWDKGFSIIQTPDSGYVVGGYTYMPGVDDSGDPLIVKFDKDGNYQWNRKPGGPLDDDKAMVCLSADSNITALTTYDDSTYGAGECGRVNIIKYNQQGTQIWNKKYGQSWHGRFAGNIKIIPDGGYISCGSIVDSTHTQYFGWMMRFDEEGDSVWYREYAYYGENFGSNYLNDIALTSDNGFIACGETRADPPNNLQKIWVLKLDSLGCDTAGCDPTVEIAEEETRGPGDKERVVEVWPNPCSTALSVSLRSRQLAVGSRQLAVGSRQSAVGSQQSAVGSRQSAVGSWQLAVGSQQSAVGSRQLAVSSRQSAVK
jgi:hypothetical protein